MTVRGPFQKPVPSPKGAQAIEPEPQADIEASSGKVEKSAQADPESPKDTTVGSPMPSIQEDHLSRTAREYREALQDRPNLSVPGKNPIHTRMTLMSRREDLALDGLSGDAKSSMDNTALYTGATSAVDLDLPDRVNRSADLSGRTVSFSRTTGSENARHSMAGRLSDGAISGEVTTHADGHSSSTGLYLERSWYSVSRDLSWTTHDGAMGVGGWVGGSKNDLSAGGAIRKTNKDGLTRSIGGMFGIDGDRKLTHLGPYQGPQPELKGTERVELSRSGGGFVGGTAGLLGASLGLGARLSVSRSKDVTYRTHLKADDAAEALFTSSGLTRFAKDKARAMHLMDENVPLPDLSQPETLRPLDEMVVTVSGSMSGGLFLGALGVGVGGQGIMRGDFELAVKKHDAHTVELLVTPTQLRGLQGSASVPFLLDLDRHGVKATSLRQGFVFDLRIPEAKQAYLAALEGNLPGGAPNGESLGKDNPSTEEKIALLQTVAQKETIPEGVSRTHLELGHLKQKGTGVNIGFTLLHRSSGFGSVGVHKGDSHYETMAVSSEGIELKDTRGIEKRRQVLLSGEESTGLFAQVREKALFGPKGDVSPQFEELVLSLEIEDSKVRGHELNDEIISVLNDNFSLDIPLATLKGNKESRQISVSTSLGLGDFEKLAQASLVNLQDTAAKTGISPEELIQFQKGLKSSRSPAGSARQIQDWIATHGLSGFSAIHRMRGNHPEQLSLNASNSQYGAPLQKSAALELQYAAPIKHSSSSDELGKRFSAIDKALGKIAEAITAAKDDPLLDDSERNQTIGHLQSARGTLEKCIGIDHLSKEECQQLWGKLDRGWTTSLEYRIMDALQKNM
jgi:hypothetical protein